MKIKLFDSNEQDIRLLKQDLKGEHEAIALYDAHIEVFQKRIEERKKKLEAIGANQEQDPLVLLYNKAIEKEGHIRDEEKHHVEELIALLKEFGASDLDEEIDSRK